MSVAKSSALFATGTFISRISGLVRDRVFYAVFGSSPLAEGFTIAYRIPNMLREMLAEGALGSSFTKVYSELDSSDKVRARSLLFDTLMLMTLVSIVVCGLGTLFAPQIVDLMTTNAGSDRTLLIHTATGLTRLLFPFLYFMIIGAVMMGVLHQRGRFFVTSVSPIAFNAVNIAGALWFSHYFAAHAPAWVDDVIADRTVTGFTLTVVLGGLAQLLMQAQGVFKELRVAWREYRRRPLWSPDVKKVFALMGPMVIAASAGQINVMVNTIFATSAGEGSVVWLSAAFRLLHFPIGIFGVAIGVAVLPALARSMAKAEGKMNDNSSREMQNAIELVLWLMVPCFTFYLVNNLEVVQLLFQSGKFNAHDSERTAAALNAYSFALISYGVSKVMTSFYYAMERTRYALKVSLFSIASNFTVNYLFVSRYGHVGLALGYSITQGVSVLLLIFGMRGHGVKMDRARLTKSLVALVSAAVMSGGIMYLLRLFLLERGLGTSLKVWLGSGVILSSNMAILVAVFAVVGLFYVKLTPRAAWQKLQSRRRR